MSKTRIRLTAPAIKTRAEMEALVGEIRGLKIQQMKRQAQREAELKAVDDRFKDALLVLGKEIDERMDLARGWAESNPGEFGNAKSIEMAHGTVGFRIGNWQLKTLSGWTWDRVLEKIRSLVNMAGYIRVKEEVNKEAILADRDVLGPEGLRLIGTRAFREEGFFVEPKIEEIEARETQAA